MAPDVWPTLSVSNSLSGRHWELDHVPAVGNLTDIVQLDTGHQVSADEGQRRVALQRRVAAYLVGGGQTPRNVASILDSAREFGIRDGQPHRHIAASNKGLIVGRPVRNAVLCLVPGMDLRLHPCSVAPAEGPEKCGPRRPTRTGPSCNNASHRRVARGPDCRSPRGTSSSTWDGPSTASRSCGSCGGSSEVRATPTHPQKFFHATTPRSGAARSPSGGRSRSPTGRSGRANPSC